MPYRLCWWPIEKIVDFVSQKDNSGERGIGSALRFRHKKVERLSKSCPAHFRLTDGSLTHHMAKRRTKKRTHVKPNGASNGPGRPGGTNRSPKSMVIRMGAGEVGPSITQLTKDVRAMMEPDTASRLKVCRSEGT
jgi:hypothetical protein